MSTSTIPSAVEKAATFEKSGHERVVAVELGQLATHAEEPALVHLGLAAPEPIRQIEEVRCHARSLARRGVEMLARRNRNMFHFGGDNPRHHRRPGPGHGAGPEPGRPSPPGPRRRPAPGRAGRFRRRADARRGNRGERRPRDRLPLLHLEGASPPRGDGRGDRGTRRPARVAAAGGRYPGRPDRRGALPGDGVTAAPSRGHGGDGAGVRGRRRGRRRAAGRRHHDGHHHRASCTRVHRLHATSPSRARSSRCGFRR